METLFGKAGLEKTEIEKKAGKAMDRDRKERGSKRGAYVFTARKHPEKGIVATILGTVSMLSIGAAVYLTYQNGGSAKPQYGAAVFLVMLYALAGLALGVVSRLEKDNYYLFPYLGIGLNFLSLAMISMILYAGI